MPVMVDRFGWCTWDTFYLTVDPAGIWQGVSELAGAGLAPRSLIIDDGWQSVSRDCDPPHEDTSTTSMSAHASAHTKRVP